MSNRFIRGPLKFSATKTVLTGDYTVVNESVVVVNKTSGAATAITLPASSTLADGIRRVIRIVDGKGDSASNNITIGRAGSDTINGGTSYVLATNYGSVLLTDCGSGVWTANTDSDPAQAQTITNGTVSTLTATNATITNLTTAGISVYDPGTLAALGTVIANAAPIVHESTTVTGNDDAKGVVLPAAVAGKRFHLYAETATNGLKVYPPVNGTINGGSANASVVIEGKTAAVFWATNSTNYAGIYTANS